MNVEVIASAATALAGVVSVALATAKVRQERARANFADKVLAEALWSVTRRASEGSVDSILQFSTAHLPAPSRAASFMTGVGRVLDVTGRGSARPLLTPEQQLAEAWGAVLSSAEAVLTTTAVAPQLHEMDKGLYSTDSFYRRLRGGRR